MPLPDSVTIDTALQLRGAQRTTVEALCVGREIAHRLMPRHAQEGADTLHLGVKIGDQGFMAVFEDGERKSFPAQRAHAHDEIVQACGILEREKFELDNVHVEMPAKAAQHDIARVAQREDNSGLREQLVNERQFDCVERMLVDDDLAIGIDSMVANLSPIVRARFCQFGTIQRRQPRDAFGGREVARRRAGQAIVLFEGCDIGMASERLAQQRCARPMKSQKEDMSGRVVVGGLVSGKPIEKLGRRVLEDCDRRSDGIGRARDTCESRRVELLMFAVGFRIGLKRFGRAILCVERISQQSECDGFSVPYGLRVFEHAQAMAFCCLRISGREVDQRKRGTGGAVVRVGPEGAFGILARRLSVAVSGGYCRKAAQGLRIVRIELNRTAIGCFRFRRFTRECQREGPALMGDGIGRLDSDGFIEERDRIVHSPEPDEAEAYRIHQPCVFGCKHARLLKARQSVAIAALPLEPQGACAMESGVNQPSCDRAFGVCAGSLEIRDTDGVRNRAKGVRERGRRE